jgi:predicted 2-oxoglutarate/Fe(II)-dependent dioxygenase YbiX
MPDVDFFTRFGFFALKSFLDAQTCAAFRSEMLSSALSPAELVDGNTTHERVKENVRKTMHASISEATAFVVKERLSALKPNLEDHFKLSLSGCESPQFLVYREGDYFQPHTDAAKEQGKPDYIKNRRLSIIISLNENASRLVPDGYGGGALTFYGLVQDPGWEKYGFQLTSETGLMIAFRSDLLHEVTTITSGTRCAIVSWFF